MVTTRAADDVRMTFAVENSGLHGNCGADYFSFAWELSLELDWRVNDGQSLRGGYADGSLYGCDYEDEPDSYEDGFPSYGAL